MSNFIIPFRGMVPKIDKTAYVAPNAAVIGNVEIGADTSIWFGVSIRGDVHEIRIGARTNIQDNSVVHVTQDKFGCYIGSDITIGHGAIIHACTLQDGSFVGMGAIVMDGAVIETGGMLAAGAMLTPGKRIPGGELWAGSPAKFLRKLSKEEVANFSNSVAHYMEVAKDYL